MLIQVFINTHISSIENDQRFVKQIVPVILRN